MRAIDRPLLLLLFLTVTFMYAVNPWFSVSGFYLFFVFLILSVFFLFRRQKVKILDSLDFYSMLAITLFIFMIFSFTIWVVDINGELSLAMWVNRLTIFASILLSTFYFIEKPKNKIFKFVHERKFFILLLAALIIQLTLIRVIKVPDIDVYRKLLYGPLHILEGKNPYESVVGYDYFTYGPAALYLFLPFDVIFGDPRYFLILASFVVAMALYKTAKNNGNQSKICELFPLIYLFNPTYMSFLTYSLIDLLIVGLLAFGFLFYNAKKVWGLGFVLGAIAGIKLFYALPFLFFLKDGNLRKKSFFAAGFLSLVIFYLPLSVLNWQALVKSSLLYHLEPATTLYFQQASLTFTTFLNRQFHKFPPPVYFPIVNLLILVILWFKLKRAENFSQTLFLVGFAFLVLLFFGPQGIANYYFIGSSLLFFSLVFIPFGKSN